MSELSNEDLAPTRPDQRTWGMWHIAALWVGMAVCIPTYSIASGMIASGFPFWLAVGCVAVGNIVVLAPLLLNAHPGCAYGIPFPVLLRASFGPLGSNIPALVRGLVACGWFGIQTWIGGEAIYLMLSTIAPGVSLPNPLPEWFGINLAQFLCFAAFWVLNVAIIIRGMESIKLLETLAAPFLILVGIALFGWTLNKYGWDAMVTSKTDIEAPMSTFGMIASGLTIGVTYWGTLALNIPDFARYAKSQRDQALGQIISLPATMTLFAFVGAAVTNATGESNPVALMATIGGPFTVAVAMVGLTIATLSTNLAANIVSPANDFSNLMPSRINFRRGALIAASIGFVIMPWKLYSDAAAYLFGWLGGIGGLLGAVGGIMICDYYIIRKKHLVVEDLYKLDGVYQYRGGFNPVALFALGLGIAPLLPGFLAQFGWAEPGTFFVELYKWSWFVAFILGGAAHTIGMTILGSAKGQLSDSSV